MFLKIVTYVTFFTRKSYLIFNFYFQYHAKINCLTQEVMTLDNKNQLKYIKNVQLWQQITNIFSAWK